RTLEWSLPSPPHEYNFAVIPEVDELDSFWKMKKEGRPKPIFKDIHMPKGTAAGIYMSLFAFLFGFGFVWEIIWMIGVGTIGIIGVFIVRGFDDNSDYTIPAEEVARIEAERVRKDEEARKYADENAEDMGLIEFMRTAPGWFFNIIRNKS